MPRALHVFHSPARFVAGTVGTPGERTFFLQARESDRMISVAVEKAQVALLAERVTELLAEVRRRGTDVPTTPPRELEDVAPLETPIDQDFRVGTLALAWDGEGARVVIEAQAVAEESAEPFTDAAEGPDTLRVTVTAPEALAFAARAARVVAAGRPPCPLCGLPLDPEGHICPRMNGHRR